MSEIVDEGGERPVFRVYEQDDPGSCFEGAATSKPWTDILKAVAAARQENRANTISGALAFLLDSAIVARLIQNLPDAEECANYQWRTFEEE